jgi:prepilin signal peptidase PulO-like enzyme (type II secretory pathway)
MPGGPPRDFSCPECGAFYKLVRIPKPETGEAQDKAIFCVHCDHPLSPKDNGFLLKYLMVGRPNKRHRHDTAFQPR